MPIGSALTATLPEVGDLGPAWATELLAYLQEVETYLEGTVGSSALNIDDDVDWGGYEIQGLGSTTYANKGAQYTTTRSIYFRSGELWTNDNNGNQIQITSGGTLNASGLGGIVGDYPGAAPAEVRYQLANTRYFVRQSPTVTADLEAGDVILKAKSAGAYEYKLKAPTLAADKTRTFAVPPASTSLIAIDSSGVEAATRAPSVDSVTATTGTITTLTVTNPVKHGSMVQQVPAAAGHLANSANVSLYLDTSGGDAGDVYWLAGGASAQVVMPITLAVNDRLVSVSVRGQDNGAAWIIHLYKINAATGVRTELGTDTSGTGSAREDIELAGINETIADGHFYYLVWWSGGNNDRLYGIEVTYDRP